MGFNSAFKGLILSVYFISHKVTCRTSFNSKYPNCLHIATANWLVPHISMFVAVVMFITIGSIKTECLYREACVDAASLIKTSRSHLLFLCIYVWHIFALLLARYRQCKYGVWHSVVTVSRDGGQLSSLSMGMMTQCRFCQYGWWHSAISVSGVDGTVSFLSVGASAKCRPCQWGWWHSVVSISRDGGTLPFLSVGMMAQLYFLSVRMVAQCRYCQ